MFHQTHGLWSHLSALVFAQSSCAFAQSQGPKNMENVSPSGPSATRPLSRAAASARWRILRRALLSASRRSSLPADSLPETGSGTISRKAGRGFGMIPCRFLNDNFQSTVRIGFPNHEDGGSSRDARSLYDLPTTEPCELCIYQRLGNHVNFKDFEISKKYNVDNTGIVCCWPAEDVLAYFCLKNADMFRSKRVLELGAGYGLAGLVVAAGTDAHEVFISDGNPQVVDYIQHSISANGNNFGNTRVEAMTLHWSQKPDSSVLHPFDVIIASDCTFFKEFHDSLAQMVKSLLRPSPGTSEAIFLNPKRGNSLDLFLQRVKDIGLQYEIVKKYNEEVWARHLRFVDGSDPSWPGYEEDHCYPLLVRITL